MTQDKELEALTSIQKTLEGVDDDEAQKRIVAYLVSRYGTAEAVQGRRTLRPDVTEQEFEFADVADLYHAAQPQTEAEKALVAGYWFQVHEKQKDFGAQVVNTALKNLGERVSNITTAMSALADRKPALAMQVKKKGTTKQARKQYRLTTAGIEAVERMVAGKHLDEEQTS